jgi:hypothetical protein
MLEQYMNIKYNLLYKAWTADGGGGKRKLKKK